MTEEIQSAGLPILEKKEATSLPSKLDDTPIDLEPEVDSQREAMHSGQARTFQGEPLAPFDWRRQEAANKLGLLIFKIATDQGEDFDGNYDGMAGDAAIVVWLCTLTPSQVAKAIRLPGLATEQRLKWAEEKIKGIGTPAHIEMTELFGEIISSYMESLAEPTKTPGKHQQE